ncbi:MAG: MopE-related protein [Myxococcota bacterium]
MQCVDVAELRLEVCNGIDDDCDGQTDGDDPGLVLEACENTAGVCGAAMKPARLCQVGAWAACDDAAYAAVGFEAGSEVSCDGLDNDCDGSTDEDFALTLKDDSVVTGVGVSCGTGACGGALTQCNPSGDGIVCPGESGVNPEVCNGIDDDCDGVSDREDPDLVPSLCERQQGVCQGALHPAPACGGQDGWSACTDGVYSTRSADYQAGVELACDSLDNDCDGKTDEDFLVVTPDGTSLFGVGQACGVGACAGGFTVCTADGAHAACSSAGNARPEVCNGIDDDCDGKTDGDDPDMVKPLCEVQKGVCSGAAKPASLCVGGQWLACGGAEYTAMAADYGVSETHCDGRDEDCDGKVDDDFKVVTADGATVRGAGSACGVGGCAGGVTVCGADGISIECSSAGSAAPEVCDGEDNDCDGKLDAADPSLVRVTCANQSGVCAGALALPDRCVGGAWQECGDGDYAAHDAGFQSDAEQKCNGKDDDCDGATDEDFSITLPTGTAVSGVGKNCGAGACSGGVTACLGDQSGTGCDSSLFTAQEVCDGEDNDCDGKTDGDDPDLQLVPCGRQRGVCAGSMKPARLCQAGAWLSCDDAVMSSHDPRYDGATEVRCDGVDNDCDGSSDEDFTLVGRDGGNIVGAGKACGTGACAGGVTACNPGGTGIICPGEARASAEVCNGQDDDCDAVTDAADGSLVLAACEDQDGVCAGAKHVAAECADGQWRLCAPGDYAAHDAAYTSGVESRCDGKDNDCDAATDEDFTFTGLDQSVVVGAGKSCGAGVCAGGTTVCDGAGTGLVCDREALAGQEVCDGDDDDCDGKTDAADGSLARVTCDNQNGTCAGSMRPASLCVNGSWTTCGVDVYSSFSPAYQSGLERSCDTIDNDCDGKSDEDFVYHQKNGADVTGGVGTACGVGVCAGGTLVCNASQNGVTCPSEQLAATEVCDGGDNDCDGFTDAADATLATVACEKQSGVCGGSKKPASLCVLGAWQACGSDVYQQFSTSYEDDHEVGCDALDNDCDGRSDEDFGVMLLDGRVVTGVGASCGTGLCAGGVTRCNVGRSGVECSTENRAVQETCDDVDDDCDGKTDAGDTSMTRDPCENQSGVCAGAQKLPARCAAGVWQACGPADYQAASPSFDGAAETHCDGLDNDCDTRTDRVRLDRPGRRRVPRRPAVQQGRLRGRRRAVLERHGGHLLDRGGGSPRGVREQRRGLRRRGRRRLRRRRRRLVRQEHAGAADAAPGRVPERRRRLRRHRGRLAHPTASELCDGVDQDCDATDEAWVDCGGLGSCDASGSGLLRHHRRRSVQRRPLRATRAGVMPASTSCVGSGAEGRRVRRRLRQRQRVCRLGPLRRGRRQVQARPGRRPGLRAGLGLRQQPLPERLLLPERRLLQRGHQLPVDVCTTFVVHHAGAVRGQAQGQALPPGMCQTSGPSTTTTAAVRRRWPRTAPPAIPTSSAPAEPHPARAGVPGDLRQRRRVRGRLPLRRHLRAGRGRRRQLRRGQRLQQRPLPERPLLRPRRLLRRAGQLPGQLVGRAGVRRQRHLPGTPHRRDVRQRHVRLVGAGGRRPRLQRLGRGQHLRPLRQPFCDGTAVQSQPQCPSTCAADSECDDAAHCDGTCVGDVPDGGTCDEASDCVSDHCTNGHCCSGDVCCAVAGDCPAAFSTPPACDDATTCRGTKDVATCVAFACGTALDVADDSACSASVTSKDCGPYPSVRCNGAVDQTSPACATSCQGNADCDANAYCRSGVCVPDEPDGGACSDDSQCQAAHCQNHFCCSGGDCCSGPNNGPIDCPSALYANAPSCDSPSTCQGSRKDPVCVAHVCTLGPTLPDDVACAAGSEASFCGLYPSVFCPGGHDQASPSCASSCGGDQDCDPGAFCQGGVCKPDLTAGSTCSAQNQCATGLTCVDGVCCTSACGGACRRCESSGNGTCGFVGDGQDPDSNAAASAAPATTTASSATSAATRPT